MKYDYLLIKIERERAGLTQAAAADLAGMHIRHIRQAPILPGCWQFTQKDDQQYYRMQKPAICGMENTWLH